MYYQMVQIILAQPKVQQPKPLLQRPPPQQQQLPQQPVQDLQQLNQPQRIQLTQIQNQIVQITVQNILTQCVDQIW